MTAGERYRFQDPDNGNHHCEHCGAVVASRRIHDEWHDHIDEIEMIAAVAHVRAPR